MPRPLVLSLLLLAIVSARAQTPSRPDPPLAPHDARARMKLPPGFSATLFAAEPAVQQPVGFAIDHRGRLWVAENFSYPKMSPVGRDRIIILEDTDLDGIHDKRTLFYEGLNYLTGLEVGLGGVWIISPPSMLFIPDKNLDDVPDAPPQVLLDGFGHQGVHNIANGFTWGPDGWLYGGHGGTSRSRLGKPAAPDDQRIPFDGGVWRYHPVKHIFEMFAEGTVNPWGMDYNDFGHLFMPNSVMPHLYHVIQGAHYERRQQTPLSAHAYGHIDTIADHLHYTGGNWQKSGYGALGQSEAGGGHAHCGLVVYLGDAFPPEYRNTILLNNIHGNRINHDKPTPKGSTYTAAHAPDFLLANDIWHHGITLRCGPQGELYLSDWYETGECHYKIPDTTNGRIYRITYADPSGSDRLNRLPRDISALTNAQLVSLHIHPNEFFVRESRRQLQHRSPDPDTRQALLSILHTNPEITRKLRALWSLHVTSGLTDALLLDLLNHPNEHLRAWSIQFLAEDSQISPEAAARFEKLAQSDASPIVRLYLASALQRLPFDQRWPILHHLSQRAEDIPDPALPLMYWYATEPMVPTERSRALQLAASSKIPILRQYITRRVAAAAK